MKRKRIAIKIAAESIGTYIFATSVGLSLVSQNGMGAILLSSTLFSLMGFTGFISGAMFNPSVTLSAIILLRLKKKLDRSILAEYFLICLFQIVFAFLGVLTAWFLTEHVLHVEVPDGAKRSQAFSAELIWTFTLVTAALAVDILKESKLEAGSAVALTLLVGNIAFKPISGACFNPAISIAAHLTCLLNGEHERLDTLVFLLAPVLASILAAVFVHFKGRVKAKFIPHNSVQDNSEIQVS